MREASRIVKKSKPNSIECLDEVPEEWTEPVRLLQEIFVCPSGDVGRWDGLAYRHITMIRGKEWYVSMIRKNDVSMIPWNNTGGDVSPWYVFLQQSFSHDYDTQEWYDGI